jgi:hypothetical protein
MKFTIEHAVTMAFVKQKEIKQISHNNNISPKLGVKARVNM